MKFIKKQTMDYIFLGDRFTDIGLKNRKCNAVKRINGKCIREKNANMLVEFENGLIHNVPGRRLRKL